MQQPDFSKPSTAPYAVTSSSSRAAAKAVAPRLKNQRERIYAFLLGRPEGRTCEQIEDALDAHRSSISTRLGELECVGYVKRTGRFLPTRSGNQGEIYVAIPHDSPEAGIPRPPRKTTLRQAAKAVVAATDAKDGPGLRDAIRELKVLLEGGHDE